MSFRFKYFDVRHENSAMKVGTDGVLLGAWASCNQPRFILDIGTGCGLIALMLAQRFTDSNIHAVEPNKSALKDAKFNFANQHFSSRISLFPMKIQDFKANCKYDLIVCNPPYFQNALKSKSRDKNVARHNTDLCLTELASAVSNLLSQTGDFALVLPELEADEFTEIAKESCLYLSRKTLVRGNENAKVKRTLLSMSRTPKKVIQNDLVIEKKRHVYTDEYIALTKDFYLSM